MTDPNIKQIALALALDASQGAGPEWAEQHWWLFERQARTALAAVRGVLGG